MSYQSQVIPGLCIIVAMTTADRVIGKEGRIPWNLPSDRKHFLELTMEHPCIMGRRTWESLPDRYRPLPGRTNIVITSQRGYDAPGANVADSIDQALKIASLSPGNERICGIGGEMLYRALISRADTLYVTFVNATKIEGDTHFPAFNNRFWICDRRSATRRWEVGDEYLSTFAVFKRQVP
ncbi:MAG: dihydrofolate reductase [Candidatus Pacebacteria bacterium]|nr:dihydrofolate reductase [Candidatus Paceibacterota bacterium]